MRHGMVNRKLGRTSAHRNALFRNQLSSLIDKERIITTLPKAKELRPQIERLVTLGRIDSVHTRRQAARIIADAGLVAKLFDTLAPRFADRPGGYTRIIKLGPRRGDAAEMAIIEFVGFELDSDTAADEAPTKAKAKKAAPKKKDKADDAAEEPKKRGGKKAAAKDDAPAADEKPKRSRKKKEE
jgi:large subunit ribosomal protein L17